MRKRRKRKPNFLFRRMLVVAMLALVVPVSVSLLRRIGPSLEGAGERAAVIAAAINMPEEGLELLRERYAGELYLPGEDIPSQPDTSPATSEGPDNHLPSTSEALDLSPQQDEPSQSGGQSGSLLVQPRIPEEYRAPLLSENFATTGSNLVHFGAGYIRNETQLDNEAVLEILETPMALRFEETDAPQVLIVHTHATEAFERYDSAYYDTRNTWRSQDNNLNMVSVGAAMTQVLEDNGIGVIHDTTQHDYPSYNGSYERSAQTIQGYLEEYPSIKVVLDLHRDAMERDNGAIVKPVTVVDGRKAAQIMIIAACDDTGDLGVPEYRQNLRFAATLQSYMAGDYKELTRPVYFCYRKYNMNLTTGSLLLEFGSNANTLDEAVYAAQMAGQALADLIWDYTE